MERSVGCASDCAAGSHSMQAFAQRYPTDYWENRGYTSSDRTMEDSRCPYLSRHKLLSSRLLPKSTQQPEQRTAAMKKKGGSSESGSSDACQLRRRRRSRTTRPREKETRRHRWCVAPSQASSRRCAPTRIRQKTAANAADPAACWGFSSAV